MQTDNAPHLPMLYWALEHLASEATVFDWSKTREHALFFVIEGDLTLTLEQNTFHVRGGELAIIPGGAKRHIEMKAGTRHVMLLFVLGGIAMHTDARIIQPQSALHIERWTEDLLKLWHDRDLSRTVTGALLLALLSHIEQMERLQAVSQAWHPSLVKAVQVMKHDLHKPLSIDDLAHEACVSVGYLQRLFQQQFGCSPLKYRQELRMTHACHLLESTDWSLSRIADECGYQDVEYFGRVFRKTYRITPTGWRDRRKTGRRRLD